MEGFRAGSAVVKAAEALKEETGDERRRGPQVGGVTENLPRLRETGAHPHKRSRKGFPGPVRCEGLSWAAPWGPSVVSPLSCL